MGQCLQSFLFLEMIILGHSWRSNSMVIRGACVNGFSFICVYISLRRTVFLIPKQAPTAGPCQLSFFIWYHSFRIFYVSFVPFYGEWVKIIVLPILSSHTVYVLIVEGRKDSSRFVCGERCKTKGRDRHTYIICNLNEGGAIYWDNGHLDE